MSLQVYQVAPAPDHTAQWMRRLLRHVTDAMRFERAPPPLEIRPTGAWSGWAGSRDMAPDGRVSVSSLVLFQSARRICDVYIHEVGHSLLHGVDGATPGHDCAFFALGLALRMRVDAHQHQPFEGSLVSEMRLYDLVDLPQVVNSRNAPDVDVGRCIAWSIEVATEMAASDLSAEGLAHEIVRRYHAWLDELRDQPRLDRIAVRLARGQAAAVDRLQDKLFVSNMVACVSSVLLMLIAVMLWCR